ncbi:MAG: DNA/RNA nuclease SfsA [Alphaproteobacteria bacterium]|jgi:sugar fermentation stimulation protein A|nr:DNA/RNA nuclease SfsA [Alphaproteobacteria bacterium]MBT5861007.1 DNA/RNA nuclease SfsA [Alphaproteobacteria bacterium]
MQQPNPLIRGTLVRRYKRFLADVALDSGGEMTVHCPNPGAMLGLTEPGIEVWLSKSDNPKRKLSHTWELAHVDGGLTGVNTMVANRIGEEAIGGGVVPELDGYANLRREVKYGKNSRVDLLLQGDDRPDCYVEIKNVHLMREAGLAEFPDSVTARGTKHLGELAAMVKAGHRAVMLYVVQRGDCDRFALAADIDPAYASAFADAKAQGVEAIAYGCALSVKEIVLNKALTLKM